MTSLILRYTEDPATGLPHLAILTAFGTDLVARAILAG